MLWETMPSLAEVHVDNNHCSPLVYPASHAIIEVYQVDHTCGTGFFLCYYIQRRILKILKWKVK